MASHAYSTTVAQTHGDWVAMVSIAAEREVTGLIPACHSKMQESEITQILAHVNAFCAMNELSLSVHFW